MVYSKSRREFLKGAIVCSLSLLSPDISFSRKSDLYKTNRLIIPPRGTHTITFSTRYEGERDLRRLANDSSVRREHNWLLMEGHSRSVWFEITDTITGVPEEGKYDDSFLKKVVREVLPVMSRMDGRPVITPYHIHPKFLVDDLFNYLLQTSQLKKRTLRNKSRTKKIMSLPSGGDYVTHFYEMRFFNGEGYSTYFPRVVSPYGIYEYGLTNLSLDMFFTEGRDGLIEIIKGCKLSAANKGSYRGALNCISQKGFVVIER